MEKEQQTTVRVSVGSAVGHSLDVLSSGTVLCHEERFLDFNIDSLHYRIRFERKPGEGTSFSYTLFDSLRIEFIATNLPSGTGTGPLQPLPVARLHGRDLFVRLWFVYAESAKVYIVTYTWYLDAKTEEPAP